MANGLTPDIGARLARGAQVGLAFQQQQRLTQQDQLAQQQADAEAARQQQLTGLLSTAIPAEGQLIPEGGPRLTPQAAAQLAVEFPEQFEQINKNLGLITDQRKREALDFSFKLRNTPFAERQVLIDQRSETLLSQGRQPTDTNQLTGLSEQDQNEALDLVQVAALSPEKRLELAQKGPEALQSIVEAEGGGFVGIDPTTRKSVFVPPPAGIRTEKQVKADRKAEEDRVTEDIALTDTQFKRSEKLRGEIFKASTEFSKVKSAFGRIEAIAASEPSPAGDMGFIFSYMKMLDPGSVVREGEFASAQNAAGVPDRVRNAYNNAIEGTLLNPKQRKDFLGLAEKIFVSAEIENKRATDTIVDIGEQFGIKREQLLGRAPTETLTIGRFTVEVAE